MCRILLQMGLLTEADLTVLLGYCKCYEQWIDATRKAEEFGPVVVTSNGNMIQSPWVGIGNTAYSNMMKAAVEFGLTPASRSRVQARQSSKTLQDVEESCSGRVGALDCRGFADGIEPHYPTYIPLGRVAVPGCPSVCSAL